MQIIMITVSTVPIKSIPLYMYDHTDAVKPYVNDQPDIKTTSFLGQNIHRLILKFFSLVFQKMNNASVKIFRVSLIAKLPMLLLSFRKRTELSVTMYAG